MSNNILYKLAKDAIDNLFSDTSVSKQETLDGLENLLDHINMLVDAINSDINREKSGGE